MPEPTPEELKTALGDFQARLIVTRDMLREEIIAHAQTQQRLAEALDKLKENPDD